MRLSTMRRQSIGTVIMMSLALAVGGCSDRPLPSGVPPAAPPVVSSQRGMLRGTVREDGTVLLESLDPSIQAGDSTLSGAIYGNQNVTARVTASAFNVANNGTTKTWTFKLAVHNLLNYPIGSVDGAAVPWDTTGMYVFFSSAPSVVSPTGCGCAVSVLNTQGQASFPSPNQLYYWYQNRLAARGQPGDSTTNNPLFTFSAPARVTSFRFVILLSAPWPRGLQAQDTSWSLFYNPVSDSFPDANAKPRWKQIGVNYGGTSSLSLGTLLMDVNHLVIFFFNLSNDQFFYRSDNLSRSENAYAEMRLALTSSGGPNPVAVLGLADSVKFVGLGVGNGKVGFATFDPNTLTWQWLAGASLAMSTTGTHTYRVGKFGAGTATNANATVSYVTYAFHATPKPN